MTSKSSSDSSSSDEPKLVWNSPLGAEETFEVKLKATLIKQSIYHCFSKKESYERLAVRPLIRAILEAYKGDVGDWAAAHGSEEL